PYLPIGTDINLTAGHLHVYDKKDAHPFIFRQMNFKPFPDSPPPVFGSYHWEKMASPWESVHGDGVLVSLIEDGGDIWINTLIGFWNYDGDWISETDIYQVKAHAFSQRQTSCITTKKTIFGTKKVPLK